MARIRVLVTTFEDVDLNKAADSWRKLGFAEDSVLPTLHIICGTIESTAIDQLASRPGVKAVEPEREVRTLS